MFAVFQGGESEAMREAASHYQESGLEEREWAWLEDFVPGYEVEFRNQMEKLDSAAQEGVDEQRIALARSRLVASHPDFLSAMRSGEIIDPDSERYTQWQSDRSEFERLMDQSFTRRYMMHYDDVAPITLLSHIFLHGGVGHLAGNMLFLLLLGILVEGALGPVLFLASYLVAGLGGSALSLAVHWGTPTGMLGASGAIAGLIGLFTVLYGRLRVRFFYWIWVYFDYVRAPAIVLLPVWLGWELVQFVIAEGSNVAYEAHAGGIVTGALIAAGVRALGWQRNEFLQEESQRENDREILEAAQQDLAALNVTRAKFRLRPLLERNPADTAVLGSWYNACKVRKEDPDLHDAAGRILALPGDTAQERALVMETFADYRQRANPKLSASQATDLCCRLLRWEALEEGRMLLDRLMGLKKTPAELPRACLLAAQQLRRQGRSEEAKPFMEAVQRLTSDPAMMRALRQIQD
ncbi:rhomboid family intramembrane serine protease [Salicola sp. Rm-C-2C1-2]|uniref:rhomboid family intramembrane serine protease n=1 Tax=Salicola sp. Rm-C-2C1-2 TaxID=3141321 RepID=UPI0032E40969